jgi:hypothetical protein
MAYLTSDQVTALQGPIVLGVFFRMLTTTQIRLSFSTSDFPMVLPGDNAGALYLASGRLQNIPDLEVLVNGIADTVTFTLSGLDPDLVGMMLDNEPEVLGAPVMIAVAPLDERWQPKTAPIPIWSGTADFLGEAMTPESDPTKNRTQTLSLTCTSGDQSRQFANLLTLSDQTQKMLSPGDNFCSRVARYVSGLQISWPRF